MREFLVDFSDDRVRLNLITEELRQNVIELTMLPLSTVFDAFPRSVRDLARTFDKDVELTIRGRETELDKKIIEQIAEPLVHMIRNALDHGLETPAERIESGKPGTGQLLIWAEQQGNRMLVAVRDDGRGIDPGALREAAVRRGLASALEMESWTPLQLLELIFQPGLQHANLGDRDLRPRRRHGHREKRGGAARRHRSHSVRAGSRDDGRPGSPAVARPPPCRAGRGGRRAVRAAHRGGAAHLSPRPRGLHATNLAPRSRSGTTALR